MAIHTQTYKGTYTGNHQEFVCDLRSDIDGLPTQTTATSSHAKCATGSSAFVIDDSSVWMLNSEGLWKEL